MAALSRGSRIIPCCAAQWNRCGISCCCHAGIFPNRWGAAPSTPAADSFAVSVSGALVPVPVGTALAPDGLSLLLDALLCPWPAAVGEALPRRWVAMQPYFYHDIPTTAGDWLRERHSGAQHGRIAVLKPDKWCSYMEYHLKLVSEGLLEGDRWHLISVQENLLFSYLEEPRTHVNIRHQPGVPSAELQEWLAVDPESHFEHFAKEQQGPDAPNFVYLPRCAGTHE